MGHSDPKVQRPKATGTLAFAIFSAAVGSSLVFGYHIGVMNAPQNIIGLWIRQVKCQRGGGTVDVDEGQSTHLWCSKLDATGIKDMFKNNGELNTLWTVIVAMMSTGALFGALTTNFFATRFGRRNTLWINSLTGIAAAAVLGLAMTANSFEMLIIGRLIAGFNVGISSGLPPLYFSELSPAHLRGAIGTVHALCVVSGILMAQILGLPQVLGNEGGWPILLLLCGLPTAYQLVALPFCPESPTYLFIEKGDERAAKSTLQRLRGTLDVEDELEEIRSEDTKSSGEPAVTIADLFRDAFLRRLTFIAAGVMLSQQFSGIDAVMFYSTAIFLSAGLRGNQAVYATLSVGVVNLLMTIVSLALVEKAGRKMLLLVGYGGMAVFTTLLTIFMLQTKATENAVEVSHPDGGMNAFAIGSVVSLLGYTAFYAVGPGATPWLLVPEMFATAPRAAATSVSTGVNRFGSLFIALTFPYIQTSIEEYTFIIFVAFLALIILFTQVYLIETKGKTTEEVQRELRRKMR